MLTLNALDSSTWYQSLCAEDKKGQQSKLTHKNQSSYKASKQVVGYQQNQDLHQRNLRLKKEAGRKTEVLQESRNFSNLKKD